MPEVIEILDGERQHFDPEKDFEREQLLYEMQRLASRYMRELVVNKGYDYEWMEDLGDDDGGAEDFRYD